MQTYGSLWCNLVALMVSGDGCWAPMRARLKTWFGARRLYYDALAWRYLAALVVAMSTKWLVKWLWIRSKSCEHYFVATQVSDLRARLQEV
ncbi:hypothetical protein VPH35_067020 [Triticum aestivum]